MGSNSGLPQTLQHIIYFTTTDSTLHQSQFNCIRCNPLISLQTLLPSIPASSTQTSSNPKHVYPLRKRTFSLNREKRGQTLYTILRFIYSLPVIGFTSASLEAKPSGFSTCLSLILNKRGHLSCFPAYMFHDIV